MSGELVVSRYSAEESQVWDEIIARSYNGTFLSSRRFLGYHPPDRFIDHSLVVRDGRSIVALFPAATVLGKSGERKLIAHPGATYGGLIFAECPSVARATEVVDALEGYSRVNGFHALLLKQAPLIFQASPTQTLDFVLPFKGYDIAKRELTTVFDLSKVDSEEALFACMDGKTRNQCKLGSKAGLEFKRSEDYASFYSLLCTSMKKYDASPVHSLEELERLAKIFKDEIALYSVEQEGRMVAGCWVFRFSHQVFHTQYLAMDYSESRYSPMNFLIAGLMKEALREGFRYFNFGISTEKGGREINWGLYKFKEGFGGRGVLLNTYEKTGI